jgi:uncharacterized glyoxalase superfamily protein PhnB
MAAKAFGAEETVHMDAPDGKIGHAELKIGDSHVMSPLSLRSSWTRRLRYYGPPMSFEPFRRLRNHTETGRT